MKKSLTSTSLAIFITGCLLIILILSGVGKAADYEIAISQFVEHPSLDKARQGFIDQLAQLGYKKGENLTIDFQNAQADFATAQTIAQKIKQSQPDLVLAIATPSAQTAANIIKNTPILITAVTDPVAAGLAASLEEPGRNVSGTTDMNPVAKQLELIKEILPDIKNLGVLYNSGEVNSVVQIDLVKAKTKKMGINLVEATVSNSSEVSLAAASLVDKVAAIYVPTDNIIVSAMPTVLQIASAKKIPVFSSENNSVEQGAIATLGIDYYQLGRQTARMAVEVLKGKDPSRMAIQSSQDLKLYLNQKTAEKIGLAIPANILNEADQIFN